MKLRVTSLVFAAAIVSALPACSPQFRATHPISLNAEFAPGSALEVLTQNGDVSVAVDPGVTGMAIEGVTVGTGDSDGDARVRADSIRIDVSVRDGKTVVQPVYPNGERRSSEGCSFVIRVPSVTDVFVDSSNGTIHLSGTAGVARLDTSNGQIQVNGHEGPLEADSSNGNVVIESVHGEVNADTSNGSIVVRTAGDLTHALSLSSSNGGITIEVAGAATGSLHAETSNGSVSVEGIHTTSSSGSSRGNVRDVEFEQPGPRHVASTSNGNVRIRMTPAQR